MQIYLRGMTHMYRVGLYLFQGYGREYKGKAEVMCKGKNCVEKKNMRKWMIKFLRKFDNCGIKIARVNLILITNPINLQLSTFIFYGVEGPL